MRHRLTWLVVITGTAMLGIILLQLFWLRNLYREQQDRFSADIENALMETFVQSQLKQALGGNAFSTVVSDAVGSLINNPKGEAGSLAKMIATIMKGIKPLGHDSSTSMTIMMSYDDSVLQNSTINELAKSPLSTGVIKKSLNIPIGNNTFNNLTSKEAAGLFNKELIKSLKKRGINIPHELAVVSKEGSYIYCSIDTAVFKKAPLITDSEYSLNINNRGDKLQLAFFRTNLFFLKSMSWILLASVLLITIFISSFYYMVVLFFKEKRISEVRNDFMNNMTHELKTPISSVSVALELVKEEHMSQEDKNNYMVIARNELTRLTMLVDKVLKIAAFEKNQIRITPESILVKPWLDQIVASQKPIFDVRTAIVRTSIQPELLILRADKTHLSNVIQNLLDNALKYNDKQYPEVEITFTEDEQQTYISVRDNGKGIPEKYKDKVFDKFFRIPSGNLHDVKGHGLGLSYVQAIVALHQGTITVDSEEGQYTSFTITIPKSVKNG